jgi:endonuclease YncB( thermonuclease family)
LIRIRGRLIALAQPAAWRFGADRLNFNADGNLQRRHPIAIRAAYRTGRVLVQAFLVLAAGVASAQELQSYALVQDDASLIVKRHRIHLYGIYLPDSGRDCRTQIRPARCATRAALALDFKIQGFVTCFPQTENQDGSLNAVCYAGRTPFREGEDLGAYLIEQGWALALPNAPFEYHALERIARHADRGVWGVTVNTFK